MHHPACIYLPDAGDLSELAMHQPPICIADPENDPGMPGMEHPILGSFDTPTDIAVDDAVDEDEGGPRASPIHS